jgi:hypothetical protein
MQFVSYENSILNPYSLDSLCSLHTIESMLWSLKITHICRITLHYFYLNRSNSHNSTAMSTSPSVITDLGRISAFNRGPLTSVFTPAATCLSTLTFIRDMYFGHQVTYPEIKAPTSILHAFQQASVRARHSRATVIHGLYTIV